MGGGGTSGGGSIGGSNSFKPKWPGNDSQLKHIFSSRKGHVADTPANRKMVENTVMDRGNLVGKKQRGGSELFSKMQDDGSQIWAEVRNGIVQDAGVNDIPRSFWPGLE
jgi:filamentous hemagglutinin